MRIDLTHKMKKCPEGFAVLRCDEGIVLYFSPAPLQTPQCWTIGGGDWWPYSLQYSPYLASCPTLYTVCGLTDWYNRNKWYRLCKCSTFSFTSHIQHVDSTSITSSSTLHLFVTQVMADFLILDTPAKLGQPQREVWHRGLKKEVILQKAPRPMDCVVFPCYLAWKAKGEEMGDPQT